jgi:hypothetical protein
VGLLADEPGVALHAATVSQAPDRPLGAALALPISPAPCCGGESARRRGGQTQCGRRRRMDTIGLSSQKKDKIGFDEQGRQFEANNCAEGVFCYFPHGP